MEVQFIHFLFYVLPFWDYIWENFCLTQVFEVSPPIFPSKCCIALTFTIGSIIHFKLSFGWGEGLSFYLFVWGYPIKKRKHIYTLN